MQKHSEIINKKSVLSIAHAKDESIWQTGVIERCLPIHTFIFFNSDEYEHNTYLN